MKKVLILVLCFSFTIIARAEIVNFDQGIDAEKTVKNIKKNLLNSKAIPSTDRIFLKAVNNVATKIAIETIDSGKEIINPKKLNGKNSYDFMPNANTSWTFGCGDENSSPGRWGFCWSYEFKPKIAGHFHEPDHLLTYINPETGVPYPSNQMCQYNIPVGRPFEIKIKMPVFSTLVLEKTEWFGACNGVQNDDVAVTVMARNLVKLEELQSEPYFVFKKADEHHPANRFATPDTNARLKQMAWEYYQMFQPPTTGQITITEMGLPWGGRFSVNDECWTDGIEHQFHRYGRQVDVRSWNMDTQEKRKCFEEIACKYQVQPLLHGKMSESLLRKDFSNISFFEADILDKAEHYHLNFARPTDPPVNPKDDPTSTCPGITPAISACPKPLLR